MTGRAKYGKGEAKKRISARINKEDEELLAEYHESDSIAVRLALSELRELKELKRRICGMCSESSTNLLDSASMAG